MVEIGVKTKTSTRTLTRWPLTNGSGRFEKWNSMFFCIFQPNSTQKHNTASWIFDLHIHTQKKTFSDKAVLIQPHKHNRFVVCCSVIRWPFLPCLECLSLEPQGYLSSTLQWLMTTAMLIITLWFYKRVSPQKTSEFNVWMWKVQD